MRSVVPERVPPPSKFNGYCHYLDCRATELNRLPPRICYSSEWTTTTRQLHELHARSWINYLPWSLCSFLFYRQTNKRYTSKWSLWEICVTHFYGANCLCSWKDIYLSDISLWSHVYLRLCDFILWGYVYLRSVWHQSMGLCLVKSWIWLASHFLHMCIASFYSSISGVESVLLQTSEREDAK